MCESIALMGVAHLFCACDIALTGSAQLLWFAHGVTMNRRSVQDQCADGGSATFSARTQGCDQGMYMSLLEAMAKACNVVFTAAAATEIHPMIGDVAEGRGAHFFSSQNPQRATLAWKGSSSWKPTPRRKSTNCSSSLLLPQCLVTCIAVAVLVGATLASSVVLLVLTRAPGKLAILDCLLSPLVASRAAPT